MKVITLRNIPPDVARRIEEKSARSGLSLNKTVISVLEEGLGLSGAERPRVRHDNLDKFCGIWSDEEANEFDRLLAEQRRVDPEMAGRTRPS